MASSQGVEGVGGIHHEARVSLSRWCGMQGDDVELALTCMLYSLS